MKKYYHYEIKMGIMNILSIVLFIIPFIILAILNYDLTIPFNGYIYLGLLFYIFIHEIFHALAFSIFTKNKKNIKIGVTLEKGVFYALCQESISKKGILISLLFPLIFLSLIPLPFAYFFHIDFLMLYIIFNFAGAIGDILMIVLILKMPNDIQYIDYDNSVGAYLISEKDLSKIKSLGFKLSDKGNIDEKSVDETIKSFYISKISLIIMVIILILCIIDIIL